MQKRNGFSLVELLAATVLLGIVLVPALNAVQASLQTERVNRSALIDDYRLLGLAETVLAEPFERLSDAALGALQPTVYSDAPGVVGRRLVFISAFDADNADGDDDDTTGADARILKVQVQIEGQAAVISTLRFDG